MGHCNPSCKDRVEGGSVGPKRHVPVRGPVCLQSGFRDRRVGSSPSQLGKDKGICPQVQNLLALSGKIRKSSLSDREKEGGREMWCLPPREP